MSGSSGGPPGFDPPTSDCGSLSFPTQLSSPKPEVVDKLEKDLELDVATDTMGDRTVVVVLHQGEIAGGIASPQVRKLRECIEAGAKFKAKVLSIDSGQVRIRVIPA